MAHRNRITAVASVLLATVCWTRWDARATDFAAAVSPKEAAQIDRLAQGVVDDAPVPGLSVGIVRNGRVAYAKGYGVLNLIDGAAVAPSSIFALGSITKQFTAAAIMQLEQQGKLSVDDSLCKYFPRFGLCGELTLRNLLNHTSVITTEIPEDMPPRARYILPVEQEMKRIEQAGLDFTPNSRYRYSNMDYAILGFVVEKVSGLSDRDYITSKILDPLGMTSTSWYTKWQGQTPNHAAGYRCANGQCREVIFHPRSHGFESAGGMVSNVLDLAKWDAGFMAGNVVDQAQIQQAFTTPQLTNGRTSNYGFAWVAHRVNGHRCYFHNGAIECFVAWKMVFPQDLGAVIVLTNRGTRPVVPQANAGWLTHQIARVLYPPASGSKAQPESELAGRPRD